MMKRTFRTILAGILFGTVLFFMPFMIIQAIILAFVMYAFFRLFIRRRIRNAHFSKFNYAFADDIRQMSEEEYQAFKQDRSMHNSHGCY